MKSTIKLFADDCVVYRKIMNDNDMSRFQKDLDRMGHWAVENAMKINPGYSKAVSFMRARVKDPLNNFFVVGEGPKNSGNEEMQIFRNNLTQRFKLG
jgi:hypothetical protein